MTWVLDTCVLLDVACNDKMFADCASRAIQAKLDDTLAEAWILSWQRTMRGMNMFSVNAKAR